MFAVIANGFLLLSVNLQGHLSPVSGHLLSEHTRSFEYTTFLMSQDSGRFA
jgi:hypothetical protein